MTRKWAFRLGTVFGFWLVVCVAGYLLGNHPRPGLIALVIVTAAGTLWLYLDTSAQSEPPRWQLVNDDPLRAPGGDSRLALLERVVSAHLDSRDVTDHLQRFAGRVVDQRLISRHGISRLADPQRAAQVLGPELAGYLDSPQPRRLSPSQIDQLLKRIEAL